MQTQVIREQAGARSFFVVFETGEEVMEGLTRFAEENDVRGAYFTAIGAFEDATIAYWSWGAKEYRDQVVTEQVEVASMTGNIALAPDGESRKVHAHVVIGLPDTSARAGHLRRAIVRPTLEVFLTESVEPLQRHEDEETGLALLKRA